eukprot:2538707-Amphidinium_carterae.1
MIAQTGANAHDPKLTAQLDLRSSTHFSTHLAISASIDGDENTPQEINMQFQFQTLSGFGEEMRTARSICGGAVCGAHSKGLPQHSICEQSTLKSVWTLQFQNQNTSGDIQSERNQQA